MCMPPYSLLPNGWQNRFLLSLNSSLLQKSLHSGGLQLPSPALGLKRYFRPPWGGSIRLCHLLRPPPPFFFFSKGSTFSNAGGGGTQPASCVDIQNRQSTYFCGCPMYGACQNDVFCGLFCSATLAI